jgi:hypothetical protein
VKQGCGAIHKFGVRRLDGALDPMEETVLNDPKRRQAGHSKARSQFPN